MPATPCEYYRLVACRKHGDPKQVVHLAVHTLLLDCVSPPQDQRIYNGAGEITRIVLWGKNLNHLKRDAEQILCCENPVAHIPPMARRQPLAQAAMPLFSAAI